MVYTEYILQSPSHRVYSVHPSVHCTLYTFYSLHHLGCILNTFYTLHHLGCQPLTVSICYRVLCTRYTLLRSINHLAGLPLSVVIPYRVQCTVYTGCTLYNVQCTTSTMYTHYGLHPLAKRMILLQSNGVNLYGSWASCLSVNEVMDLPSISCRRWRSLTIMSSRHFCTSSLDNELKSCGTWVRLVNLWFWVFVCITLKVYSHEKTLNLISGHINTYSIWLSRIKRCICIPKI